MGEHIDSYQDKKRETYGSCLCGHGEAPLWCWVGFGHGQGRGDWSHLVDTCRGGGDEFGTGVRMGA